MAKWIWKRGENRAYTWMCFVKDFSCEAVLDTALVKIAADTKYWLFINGKTVLLEGGLKRGLTPASTYYDVLDIAGNIKKGTNRIALLVWFFGKDGFSHVSCGRGGLYLDSDWGLETDESWKAKKMKRISPCLREKKAPISACRNRMFVLMRPWIQVIGLTAHTMFPIGKTRRNGNSMTGTA